MTKETREESLAGSLVMGFGSAEPTAFISLASMGDMGFGNEKNRDRRQKWLKSLDIDPDFAASVDLVHSRRVVEAASPDSCLGVEADGLCAAYPDKSGATRSLIITVADCMPIFILDRNSGAIGLLHSGWAGTGILGEAASFMARRYGTKAADLAAIFGPCIGPCCYMVDEARASVFENEFGSTAVVRSMDKTFLDLRAANNTIADKLGLGTVIQAPFCTCCDERFGSYRRQGAASFTRMAAVLAYKQ